MVLVSAGGTASPAQMSSQTMPAAAFSNPEPAADPLDDAEEQDPVEELLHTFHGYNLQQICYREAAGLLHQAGVATVFLRRVWVGPCKQEEEYDNGCHQDSNFVHEGQTHTSSLRNSALTVVIAC